MGNKFTFIKIKSFDDAASGPSGQGALLRMVLKLSENPPSEWSGYFNNAWQQHLYGMKRRATVAGNTLEIVCMPDELEATHIPELNKVILETNEAYEKHFIELNRIKAADEENEKLRKQELSKLKGRLKFD